MGHGPFGTPGSSESLDPAVVIVMRATEVLPWWLHQAELAFGSGLV
jgi:hypothetical protein